MSNAFEVLETKMESEEKVKEQETMTISKSTTMPNLKEPEVNHLSIILQVQETLEGVGEDSEMFTSEIRIKEMELGDILEQEGMDLPNMVENQKKKGMKHILEEEVKRINDIFIA